MVTFRGYLFLLIVKCRQVVGVVLWYFCSIQTALDQLVVGGCSIYFYQVVGYWFKELRPTEMCVS